MAGYQISKGKYFSRDWKPKVKQEKPAGRTRREGEGRGERGEGRGEREREEGRRE
jgi:hypothetical protein